MTAQNAGVEVMYAIYPILVENRDKFKNLLEKKGVGTNVSWPYPGYQQPHLKKFKKKDLHVTEKVASSIIGLPMFYKLKVHMQDYVIEKIQEALEELGTNTK